jgi:hypothetical protein
MMPDLRAEAESFGLFTDHGALALIRTIIPCRSASVWCCAAAGYAMISSQQC